MRIVVTGASGYIGRQVVQRLLTESHEVVALTRDAGAGNFRCLRSGASGSLRHHFEGAHHVLHLAGRLVDDPSAGVLDYFEANVRLTEAVIKAAKDAQVVSIVHASSRLIYPKDLTEPAVEDRDRAPDTPYGVSKSWAEDLLRLACQDDGMSALSLRIAQVTGGDHHGLGVINAFIKQARTLGEVTVQGRGAAIRDFLHVEDVASAFRAALEFRGPWLPINIGGTRSVSVAEIARLVAALNQRETKVLNVDVPKEDTSCYALDPGRARTVLQWAPRWSPEDIIAGSLERMDD